jgi:ABC-2 type transport system permease protein
VLVVEVVQVAVIGLTAVLLGWRPDPAGIPLALVAIVLGTAAFTSLALLVAGTLRAEAVLAVANLLLLVLAVAGGVVIPASQLPGPMAHVALLLPSGALGEAMRETLLHGVLPGWSVVVLVGWTTATVGRWTLRRTPRSRRRWPPSTRRSCARSPSSTDGC